MSKLENKIADLSAVDGIGEEYVRLIRIGKYILNCVSVGNLTIDIHSWIIQAADHITPIMPLDIPEHEEILEIRKTYLASQILIPSRVLDDVSKVFANLCSAYQCFRFGAVGAPRDIPSQNLAEIAYALIKQTRDYIKSNLLTELIGREDGRTRRTALLHSYGRIYCLAESIVKLNGTCDYLSIAGSTRAILELFLDMHLMSASKDNMDVERYFSFSDVSRLKTAKNIATLRDEYSLVDPDEQKPVEKFLSEAPDREETLKLVREKLWGKTRKGKIIQPNHWTNLSMVDRVKKIDDDTVVDTYLETYYYCNWSVHSGYSDFPGRREEDVHLYNWHLYSLSNSMFVDSSLLINKEIGVIENQTLRNELDKIAEVHSRRFWGELVKAGKEQKEQGKKGK